MPRQAARPQPSKNISRQVPRPKHVPRRTCVACREADDKRALTRIVRTPQGTVEIDPTGKKNGRGAYLCDRRSCWERAVSTPVLARALNVERLPEETLIALRHFAAGLSETPTDVPQEPKEPTI